MPPLLLASDGDDTSCLLIDLTCQTSRLSRSQNPGPRPLPGSRPRSWYSPHLRTLAQVSGEVELDVAGDVTQRAVLDAIEARYPMLCGTMRDRATGRRRPLVRFFGCEQDLSHDPSNTPLPEPVAKGVEPFLIVGAMAGG